MPVQFREKMFARFMEKMKPDVKHKVPDIGVANDDRYQESNSVNHGFDGLRLYLHPFKNCLKGTGLTQNKRKTTKYGVSQDCKTAYMGSFA